jgi:hypothetical protein
MNVPTGGLAISGGTARSVGEPAATPAPSGATRSLTVH